MLQVERKDMLIFRIPTGGELTTPNVAAELQLSLLMQLEAIQRWSGDMSRMPLNFDLSKIPFVHF